MAGKLKVAVQMDHVATINPAGDSTFAMMLEAQARGHHLWHYHVRNLALSNGRVTAQGEPVTLPTVPVIWGSVGANAQHAYSEALHLGTDDHTLLKLQEYIEDGLDELVKMPPHKAQAKRVVGEYDVSIDGHRLSGDLTE